MEKQPTLGTFSGAEKKNNIDLLDEKNVSELIAEADSRGMKPRRLRKELEMQREADLRAEKKLNSKSRRRNFGKRVLASVGITVAGFGVTSSAMASTESGPVEHTRTMESPAKFFEQQILDQKRTELAEDNKEKDEIDWPVEFQTDLEGKRYENNFGPSYTGEMNQEAIVADILDRAHKDPAFLAAMTASCGAIEQGDVDSCTADYLADANRRAAAYENLRAVLEDENTDISHYVSEETFSSTYFKGTFERTIDGQKVSGPAIGYSTNQKVPTSAPDTQKYVVSVDNPNLQLSMELRPDCGWQYNIVDEREMTGVPQVKHELQNDNPKQNYVTAPEVIYAESTPRTVESFKDFVLPVPIQQQEREDVVERIVEVETLKKVTPEVVETPEQPDSVERESTPEEEVIEEEVIKETEEPKDLPIGEANPPKFNPKVEQTDEPEVEKTEEPKDLPIGEANPPKVDLEIEEKEESKDLPIGEANPPKFNPEVEETDEPEVEKTEEPKKEEPKVEKPKVEEVEPEKDDSKDWDKSVEKPNLNPKEVKVDKETKESELTEKHIDGDGQDPRKDVEILAPDVEQSKPEPKKEVKQKQEQDDSPIYTELKKEYQKREAEENLKKQEAHVNETQESKRQAEKFEAEKKKQEETEAREQRYKQEQKNKDLAEAKYQKMIKEHQEKQRQKEADAKLKQQQAESKAKAQQEAEAKAKQQAEQEAIKIEAPEPKLTVETKSSN